MEQDLRPGGLQSGICPVALLGTHLHDARKMPIPLVGVELGFTRIADWRARPGPRGTGKRQEELDWDLFPGARALADLEGHLEEVRPLPQRFEVPASRRRRKWLTV